MKFVLSTLLIVSASIAAFAQCTPDITLTTPGLYAPDDTVVKIGEASELLYQFVNFDQITSPAVASVDSVRFDSITNLPAGLQWESNNPSNQFSKSEVGCFRIYGTPTGPVGIDTANILVSAWIDGGSTPQQQPASVLGIYIIIEVEDVASVNEVAQSLSNFTNSPNPFGTYTNISFTADKSANYTLTVFNTLGKVVREQEVAANVGNNTIRFEKESLQAGVYLYSISNGKDAVTKSMIITE